MTVDSFKFLPRLIAMFYRMTKREPQTPIPWTQLERPLRECTFGLVTSAGLYVRESDPPFDVERERQGPTWGDPSFRAIPSDIERSAVGASHLHFNTTDVEADFNIQLPIHRFLTLVEEGRIGGLAASNYSFMGYQGFPPDTTDWEERYGPEVAEAFINEGVNCVLLTPA
ncbi:MAG TPA: glycine/sarcosine/betaine reductase selenoprotein B family protein [Anaerolineales bacterium]|nr:glycine/sarcosine/betaine reductase selenoprotein B family protein [Anaerolineales bacterium]